MPLNVLSILDSFYLKSWYLYTKYNFLIASIWYTTQPLELSSSTQNTEKLNQAGFKFPPGVSIPVYKQFNGWESIHAPLGFVHQSLTITPPCQYLNSYIFFILTNRFLPLWNQRKKACGPAGNRSSPFRLRAPQHHSTTAPPLHQRDFCILPNPFVSLFSQLTLWLYKGLGA